MKPFDLAELLLLAAIWGASFLCMRIAAPEWGPWLMAAGRGVGAALMLMPILWWQGHGPALRRHWRPIAVIGVTNSALPFLLFAFASTRLNAGLSAIFNASTPLWGALIGWWWLSDRPGRSRAIGLVLGFAGVLGLAWQKAGSGMHSEGWSAAAAIAACLAATALYGWSANWSKRALQGVPPMAVAAGSQLTAAVLLGPLFWILPWPAMPGSQAWLAEAVLALLCTGAAYILYFRLISRIGPTRATSVTFLIPVFAVAWAWSLLAEAPTQAMVLGAGVILLGTSLSTGLWQPRWLSRPA